MASSNYKTVTTRWPISFRTTTPNSFSIETITTLSLPSSSYVELSTDESISSVISAYLQRGGYNVLLLDWSNLAFGNYVIIAKTLPDVSKFHYFNE